MYSVDQNELITISKRPLQPGFRPMVSISCLVYNHERFLRSTLDSFLMQQTSFPIEILVHDDASTDRSKEIIQEYQQKHPYIIKPIYQENNQYSKGLRPGKLNMKRAVGKYYALCEGDDSWTDPLKLQKQVSFLEANPHFSLCCGGYIARDAKTGNERVIIHSISDEDICGFRFGLPELNNTWLTKTLTAVYRKNLLDIEQLPKYRFGRDIHLFYHLIKKGEGYYMKEVLGVHNIHAGGVNSMKKGRINLNAAYNCYRELYHFNKDFFTRRKALKATLALLNYDLFNNYSGNTSFKKLRLLKEALSLVNNTIEVKWLINSFVPLKLKKHLKTKRSERNIINK